MMTEERVRAIVREELEAMLPKRMGTGDANILPAQIPDLEISACRGLKAALSAYDQARRK